MLVTLRRTEFNDLILFQNLYNLYLNEMSIYKKNNVLDEEGYYNLNMVNYYFSDRDHYFAYIIYFDEKIVGFVTLSKYPNTIKESDYCLQDIYVLPFARTNKIGSNCLKKIFDEFKGKYYFVIDRLNNLGISFFENNIEELKKEEVNGKVIGLEFIIK